MQELSDQYAAFHPKDLITPAEPYMNSVLYNETPDMTQSWMELQKAGGKKTHKIKKVPI